jgi:isoleucyl-tRNA synthetase
MVAVDKRKREAVQKMQEVILEEVNIKNLVVLEDDSGIVNKSAKPNFKSIGPKFGKRVNPVANAIRNFGKSEISNLEKGENVVIHLNGDEIIITKDDVDIISSEIKGWLVESEEGVTVAVDTELNDSLIEEGLAREFVNRVQNMRKDAGLEVTDRINISFTGSEKLVNSVNSFREYIANEILADKFTDNIPGGYKEDWEIGDYKCRISIKKA